MIKLFNKMKKYKIKFLFEDLKIDDYKLFKEKALLEKVLAGEPLIPAELKYLLNNGIVDFEFIKVDGVTRRKARATRMTDYVPARNMPHGGYVSPKILPWYDLKKQAWRSISKLRTKELVKLPSENDNEVLVQVKDKEYIKTPKYTREKYEEIKRLREKGLTMSQIAKKMGYAGHSDISKIIKKYEPETPANSKPRLKQQEYIKSDNEDIQDVENSNNNSTNDSNND